MEIRFRRAFSALVQEVLDYITRFGGFDLSLYGLSFETIKDFNELPMLIELTKAITRYIYSNYTSNWNNYGYFFWNHARNMEDQLEILEPVANEMIQEEEMDIIEILNQLKPPKVLPDGINYKKYNEIFEQLKLPNAMFQYIFICENILRKFIIQVLDSFGVSSIDSLGITNLSGKIQKRRNEESNQLFLPIRGDHDIYYLDLTL